jgi:hypothetical protein
LEVTVRTVYRDIATLQTRPIPIEGAPGIGYVLRRGFELPPLMFTEDEAEPIAVGVRMLARTGDPGLQKAADSVLSKVTLVVPDLLHEYLRARRSISRRAAPARRDLPTVIRHAICDSHKMRIDYQRAAPGYWSARSAAQAAITASGILNGSWSRAATTMRSVRKCRISVPYSANPLCNLSCKASFTGNIHEFSSGTLTASFTDGKSLTIALSDDHGTDIKGNIQLTLNSPTGVPEPASQALLASALVGFGAIRRRRRKAA